MNIFLLFLLAIIPVSSAEEIPVSSNTVDVSIKLKAVAIDSSVLVATDSGYGSGNYFKIDDNYVVITAAHVVTGNAYASVKAGKSMVLGSVIYKDDKKDYAVLLVPKIGNRVASEFKIKKRFDHSVGETVFYAGYPNRSDLMFFVGRITRMTQEVINIHSYAWMGASGSVVFDLKGRVVGIITAVEVGNFLGEPRLIEDVVWMTPGNTIDIAGIRDVISKI
jgi:S1-C subfamily serine protease